jgi:hypothetical protein
MILGGEGGSLLRAYVANSIGAGLFDEPESDRVLFTGPVMLEADRKKRVFACARRLVVGLLVAMQNSNFKEHVSSGRVPKQMRDGAPEHRTVYVGAPIKTDCRPALAQYLCDPKRGKAAPPSVQVLVRGHYKRQVVGVGRSGRKVIWVEPYWRGPEDAPILVHPYKVGT